jgi:hypothetical protein
MSESHPTKDDKQKSSEQHSSHVQAVDAKSKGDQEQEDREQQDKEGEEEGNTTQDSIIVHSTPDKDRDFKSSFDELALGSPAPSHTPARSSSLVLGSGKVAPPDTPDTPKSTISQGADSSFEIISGVQSPIWSSNPSSRVVSGSSIGGISNSASDTSVYSNPSVTKITLTAPATTVAPASSSAASQALRPRPFAGITPRHPSTAPRSTSAQHLKVNVQPETPPPDTRRRSASEGKVRARSSLSPMLSPIPDIAQDSIEGGLASLSLDPKASTFMLPPPGRPEAFPEHASFAYIVKYGKNSIGDLTKEARKSLSNLGLRSIPAMRGPLSLPYARCPSYVAELGSSRAKLKLTPSLPFSSGIDAFLFSAEKEEDPWTVSAAWYPSPRYWS